MGNKIEFDRFRSNFLNSVSDMEDAHTQLLSLPGDKDACFFGVYDGHGGNY